MKTRRPELGEIPHSPERRRWLRQAGGLALAGLLPVARVAAAPLRPTPMQSAGPFYPARYPDDSDNDLVQVAGRDAQAGGEITALHGRVVDTSGRPLVGARVEIWQCDVNGRYHHPRDPARAPLDANFQGYGRDATDGDGRYRFRTIRPVPYPGRTPHIHFAVHGAGLERPLVTQMYVAGHDLNREDFLLRRVPAELRDLLLVPFEPGEDGGWRAEFRIVVDASGRLS